ncbi:MAG: ABC transporter permease subunit [Planctomycetota bacterium]|nr:ABC transporter permease subunit [Planctomycetota bacterium]
MSGMWTYFIRRMLLIPVTFIVITFIVYGVLRITPGGPIEQLENQMRAAAAGEAGGGSGGMDGESAGLDEKARDELKAYYNLDQPIPLAYLQWLGVYPKKTRSPVSLDYRREDPGYWQQSQELWGRYRQAEDVLEESLLAGGFILSGATILVEVSDSDRAPFSEQAAEADQLLAIGVSSRAQLKRLLGTLGWSLSGTRFMRPLTPEEVTGSGIKAELQKQLETQEQAYQSLQLHLSPRSIEANRNGSYYHFSHAFSGILQGDFGRSFTYNEDALTVIISKFPISIYFGLIGYLATWLVCIPLGISKAIRHRGAFDTATSVLVFLGYATPGFVACLLLLVLLGGGSYWNLVPLGGFRSDGWNQWWEQGQYLRCVIDQVQHTLVPMFGYLVGSFASMTVLMKNSLLENFGADYVRTAFAKGLPEGRVIYVHALRNSLIPITAGIGHFLGLLFAGSFLIEKVCNIPGMGLLGYESIIRRDYPIILATLVIGVLIRLTGNIFSDLIWALIDPRIRFK